MRTRLAAVSAILAALTLAGLAVSQPGGGGGAAGAKPSTAPAGQPAAAAPAQPAGPKKWEIAADAKPVERRELEGGLIIEDFVVGTGVEAKDMGTVVAFYHGTLKSDGKVFDSAFERNEPAAFPLRGVIAGWQKGVPGMKVGGLRRLTVPFAMAYGEQGRPPVIPAKADLVFVIELVDVLQAEDLKPGTGAECGDAGGGSQFIAVTKHTIKTKDGKEIENTGDNLYVWLPGELMGLDMGLAGMKVGGKRKLVIPATMARTPPGLISARPAGQDLIMEVELVAVRNLPGGR
ncbi:MAG: FKBP-type peptidyl-prolyl cis-trans isomerase [Phycisphaerae bacterium]|nr:FKBP-type peptidyl-prolyl cis-trans isomerase [Phycisphaerae bacterium]